VACDQAGRRASHQRTPQQGAYSGTKLPLQVGQVLQCVGRRYSGGSDGIPLVGRKLTPDLRHAAEQTLTGFLENTTPLHHTPDAGLHYLFASSGEKAVQTDATGLDGCTVAVDNGRAVQRVPVHVACVSASTRRQASALGTRRITCHLFALRGC
jgi:hypothetical protein